MADVKWIKITTDIFDDEKILLIESLPDAYSIITVWFKLLCLAGKQNNSGVFMMSNKIAYTDKMLATIFRMKETTVAMALQTFEQFGMIEIVDGVITIPNWNKHQTLDSYEKKKERDRLYQQERRAAQRALVQKSSDISSDTSSYVAISDKDIEEDIDIDKDIEKEISKEKEDKKPVKHKYGEYNNVLLSDDELEKLKTKYSDYEEKIDDLSFYIASKGAKYQSHYLTILSWDRKKQKEEKQKKGTTEDYENITRNIGTWI